jgi:hypothetical protein
MTGTSSSPNRVARFSVAFAAAAAIGVFGASARADDPKCPPGSWFCAETDIQIGAPATPPPAPTTPATPPAVTPASPPPPVVIYTPAPPPPVYTAPPAYYPPPPPPPPPARHKSEIGLSFRLDAAAFGQNDASRGHDSGAVGVGGSLRFRPTPRFALDIGLDALSGTDANGYKRSEVPLSILGLLYLNPRSRAQVYLLGGFGFSTANVEVTGDPQNGTLTRHEQYSYFGAMFGGGLEIRVARKVALNFDIRGFVRGRTDDAAASKPEFTAKDGRTTNTSGGALFSGGLTFYF